MVADLGVTAVPDGGAASHFADVVVDRLWLRVRRGLDVDVLQEPWAALHAIAGSFASWPRSPYDLVVLVVDPPEALGGHEQHSLAGILQSVLMQLLRTTRVVLIALEAEDGAAPHRPATDVDILGLGPSPSAGLTTMRIRPGREGSADAVAEHLQTAIEGMSPSTAAGATPEAEGAAAGLDRRLAHIALMARSAYDADIAAVLVADHGRLRTVACDGAERGDHPQAGSLGGLTLGQDRLVVVGDTSDVPALQGYPAVRGPASIRFYAGYPISAPGRPGFAALCVYDREPHEREEFDFTVLRDLALLAEGELTAAGLG